MSSQRCTLLKVFENSKNKKKSTVFQHIDNIMTVYGAQVLQAVNFILEGDHHSADIKEQVSTRLKGLVL